MKGSARNSLFSYFTPNRGKANNNNNNNATSSTPHSDDSVVKSGSSLFTPPPKREVDSTTVLAGNGGKRERVEEQEGGGVGAAVVKRVEEQEGGGVGATVVKRGLDMRSDEDDDGLVLIGEDEEDRPLNLEGKRGHVLESDDSAGTVVKKKHKEQQVFGAWEFGQQQQEPQDNGSRVRKQLLDHVSVAIAGCGNDSVSLEDAIVSEFPFLKQPKDAQKRLHSMEGSDPTTLLISDAEYRAMSDVRQQYWRIKSQHYDKIVFFQVGSFYELFAFDAVLGTELLGLKVHSETQVGFPTKDWQNFAQKFMAHNYKVLRVDQGESDGKIKLRHIGEFLTLGTVVDANFLPTGGCNYVMCIAVAPLTPETNERWVGVTFSDLTLLQTHVVAFMDDESLAHLLALLDAVRPSELVYCVGCLDKAVQLVIQREWNMLMMSPVSKAKWWGPAEAQQRLERLFKGGVLPTPLRPPVNMTTLDQLEEAHAILESFGGLVNFLEQTTISGKTQLLLQSDIKPYTTGAGSSAVAQWGSMIMDATTVRNMDLFVNSSTQRTANTLWDLCNQTHSPFGDRLLRKWIMHPLTDIGAIQERQDAINTLMDATSFDGVAQQKLTKFLRGCGDIDRVICRIHATYAGIAPEQAEALPLPPIRTSLFVDAVVKLRAASQLLTSLDCSQLPAQGLLRRLLTPGGGAEMPEFATVLQSVCDWEAKKDENGTDVRLVLPEGRGDSQYEAARRDARAKEEAVADFLEEAKRLTGQSKIKYKVESDGRYVMQVTIAGLSESKIPKDWNEDKKATKTMRLFTSARLRSLTDAMQTATQEFERRASSLVSQCMARFDAHYLLWRRVVNALASLDGLIALAHASTALGASCTPTLVPNVDGPTCTLLDARHPIMERTVTAAGLVYIPNDIVLDKTACISIVTGPNSGGKSTVLRTVACMSIMAQMGMRVPCREATLSVVDRIFTRIGAQDFIMRGQSTFMVEMAETATILRDATPRSLVIIDELGRGTSTNDGYAIAWAVLHHLLRVKPLSLFATHYHGLVDEFRDAGVACHFMQHLKDASKLDVVFLYRLLPGTGESYGLNVAQMAGMPLDVLSRAQHIIERAKKYRIFDTSAKIATTRDLLSCADESQLQVVMQESGFIL